MLNQTVPLVRIHIPMIDASVQTLDLSCRSQGAPVERPNDGEIGSHMLLVRILYFVLRCDLESIHPLYPAWVWYAGVR